jgi:hypothetical protein
MLLAGTSAGMEFYSLDNSLWTDIYSTCTLPNLLPSPAREDVTLPNLLPSPAREDVKGLACHLEGGGE